MVGYVRDDDCIEVEYSSEPGRSYRTNVEESVGDGKLRLHEITCATTDLYEEVTEIGAGILVRWTEEDLKGSGWRPGWYVAVQSFDRESDEINIIYDREPDELYVECVTTLITEGRVKPKDDDFASGGFRTRVSDFAPFRRVVVYIFWIHSEATSV